MDTNFELLMPVANEGPNAGPGLYLPNTSRLVEANFSEPLTNYAVGWKDPNNIQETLDFLAPPVNTSRRFEYIEFINAEEFLLDGSGDDVRGVNGNFKTVEYTSKKDTATTDNKGLQIIVDLDNVTGMPNWRLIYTDKIMRRLMRNELNRAYTLIAAAATGVSKTWSSGSPDPDQDVLLEITTATDSSGVRPNRVFYGVNAWNKRILGHRSQATAAGFASAGLNPQGVADWLGVDAVKVSHERYVNTFSTSTTKSQIVGANVIVFYADNVATPEDPSNAKRFISPTLGGTPFRVYEQQINSKLVSITVEYYSKIIVTSTLGLRKIAVS